MQLTFAKIDKIPDMVFGILIFFGLRLILY